MIQLTPLKNKKNFFFDLSEGMEDCKVREKSGKSQGILKWMISGNPEFSGLSTGLLI